MGVTNFLGHALKHAGKEVDLRNYRDGIVVNIPMTRKRRRRSLRIALDASHWVHRASYKFGHMLAEEGHFSHFGRHQLVRATIRHQQQQQQQQAGSTEQQNQQEIQSVSEETIRKYITQCCMFVVERLRSLKRETNAELLVILDGATPPIKRDTVKQRSKSRREHARKRDAPIDVAASSRRISPDSDLDDEQLDERFKANRRAGAGKYFSRIVEELLMAMRLNNIPYLVAPYEADSQLAWLSRERFVDIVITEDSDLMAMGATCILYKLNISTRCQNSLQQQNSENQSLENQREARQLSFAPKGVLIQKDDLSAVALSKSSATDGRPVTFNDMSSAMISVVSVAAGCDYCENLKGIGVVTACDIVERAFLMQVEKPPLALVFERLYQKTYDRSIQGDIDKQKAYERKFLSALFLFRHPIVYNPFARKYVMIDAENCDPELTRYAPYRSLFDDKKGWSKIAGELEEGPIATFIAEGWVSPRTKELYDSAKIDSKLPHAVKEYFGLESKENPILERSGAINRGSDGQLHTIEIMSDDESTGRGRVARRNSVSENSHESSDNRALGDTWAGKPTGKLSENMPAFLDERMRAEEGAETKKTKSGDRHRMANMVNQRMFSRLRADSQESLSCLAKRKPENETQSTSDNGGLQTQESPRPSQKRGLGNLQRKKDGSDFSLDAAMFYTQDDGRRNMLCQGATENRTQSSQNSMRLETQETRDSLILETQEFRAERLGEVGENDNKGESGSSQETAANPQDDEDAKRASQSK